MADIFISYSQGSPEATQDLALDLTSTGYTVWFDLRLLPMDVFWKVIRDEIKAAKAVIVIWSPRATDSEWVYSEAKLAHEMKKLICVRTAGCERLRRADAVQRLQRHAGCRAREDL